MYPKKKDRLIDQAACIILAGGQGTRLFPLTKYRCKPAVHFGGRYCLIDVPISHSLHAQIPHIFIISQYFASALNAHVQKAFPSTQQRQSVHFLCPEERLEGKIWYEGTADAIRKNLNALATLPIDYFLILSGDQLYHMDFTALLQFADDAGVDLTIAALPVEKKDAPRLGILKVDENGTLLDFVEKPKNAKALQPFAIDEECIKTYAIRGFSSPCFLASMGIYVFKKNALIRLLQEDERPDFGMHLIPAQLKASKGAAFVYQGYWEDIGTIASYYRANLALITDPLGFNLYNERLPIYTHSAPLPGAKLTDVSAKHSIICEGAIIEASTLSHSIIGPRSVIKRGTTIQDSILMGNQTYTNLREQSLPYTIGENCQIEKTIIDLDVTIGNDVQLVNQKNLQNYDGDGIYIRDGITIVTSQTTIPNGFTL